MLSLAGERLVSKSLVINICFVATTCIAHYVESPSESLITKAAAAIILFAYAASRAGFKVFHGASKSQKLCWIAGFLYSLACLSERGASHLGSLNGAPAVVPCILWLLSSTFRSDGTITPLSSDSGSQTPSARNRSYLYITLFSFFASWACGIQAWTPHIFTFSLTLIVARACFLFLLENALARKEILIFSEKRVDESLDEVCWARAQDTALSIAFTCGLLSFQFEDWSFGALNGVSNIPFGFSIVISALQLSLLIYLTDREGSLETSMGWTYSILCVSLVRKPTLGVTTLSFLACACGLLVHDKTQLLKSWSSITFSKANQRRATAFTTLCLFILAIIAYFQVSHDIKHHVRDLRAQLGSGKGALVQPSGLRLSDSVHPIAQLVGIAEEDFQNLRDRQSKSLSSTVQEYRRRYHLPPPPSFDLWYEYARANDVQIYDEYDTIYETLLPFWGLRPALIRERVREAIGFPENNLIAVLIRDGEIARIEGGLQWQQDAIFGLLESFVAMLPDMDIAFNAHDEPRIILAHDELSRFVAQANEESIPRALQSKIPVNEFTSGQDEAYNERRINEYRVSRFNEYAQQNTWIASRLSCAPDSPARDFNELLPDRTADSHVGALGFIYNQTAFTDVCISPSFKGTHGFFDRPNAFNVAHDLIPIFSESKISTFQDIVYPSLWHWYGRLPINSTYDMNVRSQPMYDPTYDVPWEEKKNTLYWRGSTTGGYSRNGGWRRQHRQRIVRSLNAPDSAIILTHTNASSNHLGGSQDWTPLKIRRATQKHLMDVRFSGVGQCDPGDCDAQEEFFSPIAPFAKMHDTFTHRHMLDMDGNAFSARFYALLRSRGLVYKMAVFREWHAEWIKPWVHYIPLGLNGTEVLEAVRWFSGAHGTFSTDGDTHLENGAEMGERLALEKKEWAEKALRREDMQTWMFRLLLEYGRLIDDRRENIGFPG